jgi:prepilin-type processing-associated H-X9-DG protein
LYANENNGTYPRTGYFPDAPVPDLTNLGYNCTDPFDSTNTLDGRNNVPSVLYLLARTENINMLVFVCDYSNAQVMSFNARGGVLNHCNFAQVPGGGALGNLSYSIENPYPGTEAIVDGWRWNNTLSADYAVAADLNPGKGGGQDPTAVNITSSAMQMRVGNSLNHRAIGQNVLFGDGHVDFEFQPMCGVLRDCIYTQGGTRVINSPCPPNSSIIVGPPNSRDDSVLLPTQY